MEGRTVNVGGVLIAHAHTIPKRIALAMGISLLLGACASTADPPPQAPATSLFELPGHFPEPIYRFEGNPLTQQGFELGRKLFYDKRLSRTGTISCGSCHHLANAFADPGMPVSLGVDGLSGRRNSTAIFNLAWIPHFMQDGGINHIEVMPVAPLTEAVEMDNDLPALIDFLNNQTEYPTEFEAVFGESEVTTPRILWALTQFQGSMVSAGSKYDDYIKGNSSLSAEELEGKVLFEQHCAHCHQGPLFSDFSFRNNGLSTFHPDERGRMTITNDSADYGKFRVPSLRNIALTFPYMHDGRFASLEEVLEHYSETLTPIPQTDPTLQSPLPLSNHEKEAIISFLHTLTDFEFVENVRFKDPFE